MRSYLACCMHQRRTGDHHVRGTAGRLLQIWDLASGGGPALNQLQFNTAMRLVALAQVRAKFCVIWHMRRTWCYPRLAFSADQQEHRRA